MAEKRTTTIVAVYGERAKAEGAIDELWHRGYAKEEVGMAAPGEPLRQATTATSGLEQKAADGAVTGGITGGALGGVTAAAVAATIPGVGPVLAMGILLGLTTGAALGSFAGPFIALGLASDSIANYQAHLKAGRCLVVVHTSKPEMALHILQSHDPEHVEIDGDQVLPAGATA